MRIFMIISLAAASFATASQADGHMGDLQVQPLLRSSETLLGTEFSYPEGKALITSALATLPAGGVVPKHFHPSPMYVVGPALEPPRARSPIQMLHPRLRLP